MNTPKIKKGPSGTAGIGKTGVQQPNYKGTNAKMSRGSSGTVAKNPGKR